MGLNEEDCPDSQEQEKEAEQKEKETETETEQNGIEKEKEKEKEEEEKKKKKTLEERRAERIAQNSKMIESLGLTSSSSLFSKEKRTPSSLKRKASSLSSSSSSSSSSSLSSIEEEREPTRRSLRNRKVPPDFFHSLPSQPPPEKKKRSEKEKTKRKKTAEMGIEYTPEQRSLLKKAQETWIDDMHHFLLKTPHGRSSKTISEANARTVIRQVKLLASGSGIPYKHWPEGIIFAKDNPIDLSSDFVQLFQEADEYESRYGEDKGHGWLLKHPITKLYCYQCYLLENDLVVEK